MACVAAKTKWPNSTFGHFAFDVSVADFCLAILITKARLRLFLAGDPKWTWGHGYNQGIGNGAGAMFDAFV
jgi:hypothetical protein